MTTTNNSTHSDHQVSVVKPILIGAGVGFLLISFFVFGIDEPDPAWPKLWIVKPLIITPAAGAIGGAFYCLMDYLSSRGLNKTVAVILSLIVFIIVLWLGTVLGLNGTMWN